jgi:nucleotide-binding universal stress UspA family protein
MSSSKIIVGVDGSEHSIRAVQWCAAHAAEFDAEVIAVHVINSPVYLGNSELPMPPSAQREESPAQRKELRDLMTRDWCKPLADAGVSYRFVLLDGIPSVSLVQAAQTENAELVVTGRRGRGGFAELLLGSTSHQLTHHLDRPLGHRAVTSRRAGEPPAGDLLTDDTHVVLSLARRPIVPEQSLRMDQCVVVADLVRVTAHEDTPSR